MATVLAYTSPARGHLFPLTPILLELKRRGHRVHLRTLGAEVETLRRFGVDAAPLDPRIEALQPPERLPRGQLAALKLGIQTFVRRAPHEAEDMQRALEATKPDAVIVDINSWGGLAMAEKWGGPWAEFSPYTPAIPSKDAPPFGPGLPPARGPLGRARDWVLRPLIFGTLERAVMSRVNAVREGLGLRRVSDARGMFTTAPLVLVMTAEPFEYPRRDWPEQFVLIGPCEWSRPPHLRRGWTASPRPSCW